MAKRKTDHTTKDEDSPDYTPSAGDENRRSREDAVVAEAIRILESRLGTNTDRKFISTAEDSKKLVTLNIAQEPEEVFGCMWLDNRHRLLGFEVLYRGTINHCDIPMRAVVRRAIEQNAGAVILAHNHPSGDETPSKEDIRFTMQARETLAQVDVRVLDHIIVGGTKTYSLAEAGKL